MGPFIVRDKTHQRRKYFSDEVEDVIDSDLYVGTIDGFWHFFATCSPELGWSSDRTRYASLLKVYCFCDSFILRIPAFRRVILRASGAFVFWFASNMRLGSVITTVMAGPAHDYDRFPKLQH